MLSRSLRPLSSIPAPRAGIDWGSLGFGLNHPEHARMVTLTTDKTWSGLGHPIEATPYAPLTLEPSATILNYGQGIFEGIKAFRTARDRIAVFRPERNAQRFSDGAEAMSMPPVPHDLFLKAVATAVRENASLVPPVGEGALYLRPILFGSGGILGLGPSSAYHFIVYAAPVGIDNSMIF